MGANRDAECESIATTARQLRWQSV